MNEETIPNEIAAETAAPEAETKPKFSPKPTDWRPAVIGGAVIIVMLAILIVLGLFLFNNPATTAVLRDIFIIMLGFVSIFIGILLVLMLVILTYLVLKINDLIQLIQNEVAPMLKEAGETVGTIKGTTEFISEKAVNPIINTLGYISAVKAAFKNLTRQS